MLFKDSVYTAIGLAADILHDQVDFGTFIDKTLVPEAGKQKPGFNIIRRRIAIIISQWIAIKIGKEKKPIVYQIFQHLMDKSDPLNDQVVRVTAGRKFIDVANEWEFSADDFLPYAPVMLERLMALVQEVELPETKMALLNTISVIVERMEHHVSQLKSFTRTQVNIPDHTLCKQYCKPASASLGTVWQRASHEASNSHYAIAFNKCHEGRLARLSRFIPAHHSKRCRAGLRNAGVPS